MDGLIRKVFITAPGDPSVGIQSTTLVITDAAEGGWIFDLNVFAPEDRQPFLEDVRQQLQECFGQVLDDRVIVEFDLEVRD